MEGLTFHDWQNEIIEMIQHVADNRSIYWYWSHTGNIGKSALAKHMLLKYGAILGGGKASDSYFAIKERIKKKESVDVVLFSIPRSLGNKCDYEALECVKDGMIFSSKYESGQCLFNPPHVIIFANHAPDLSMLSEDRWKVKCLDRDFTFNNNRE